MNTASRMESHGLPGKIQVSPYTVPFLQDVPDYRLIVRGMVAIKGKGELQTSWLESANQIVLH